VSSQSPTVLVIVYYFPPWGGGPVLRTIKFVKYLAELGWRIQVLTARPTYYEPIAYDSELLDEVGPHTHVHRTRSLQPLGLGREALLEASGGRSSSRLVSRMMPVLRWLHRLLVPDAKILWLPFALWSGLRLVRMHRVDVIYVSSPPHSSLLLALALSRLSGRRLVVDMRDDWIGNPLYSKTGSLRAWLELRMEAAVIHGSRAVIVPTRASLERMKSTYREHAASMHHIPNGFDDSDVTRVRSRLARSTVSSNVLTCIYTGLLNQRRNPVPLLRAVHALNRRQPGAVRLRLAGFVPRFVNDEIEALGLEKDVDILGYVSHSEAIEHIMNADVAILLSTEAEGSATAIPSKLYEYVACDTYVLALVDPGATFDMVTEHDWGRVCAPSDPGAIEWALQDLYARKQQGILALSSAAKSAVASYGRRQQSERLSAILAEAL
jgi:glycosyltransferase involved in cell wall biosynthesis